MGFSSDAAVDRLDYDFTTGPRNDGLAWPDGAGKGVTPEPTEKVLQAFQEGYKALAERTEKVEQDPSSVPAADIPTDDDFINLLANLCSHQPSADELAQLPPRLLQAFAKWLLEALYAPKD